MKRSIYKLEFSCAAMPFPMPPPQREQAMRILVEEARQADMPPAMLVTHLPRAEERDYTVVRVRVMRRILDEVPGVGVRMLARAFRRDAARIRELLKTNDQVEARRK